MKIHCDTPGTSAQTGVWQVTRAKKVICVLVLVTRDSALYLYWRYSKTAFGSYTESFWRPKRTAKRQSVYRETPYSGGRVSQWTLVSRFVSSEVLARHSYILNHLGTVSMFGESLQIDGIRKEAKPQIKYLVISFSFISLSCHVSRDMFII